MIGAALMRRREAAGFRWFDAVVDARLDETWTALAAVRRARRRLAIADALLDLYRLTWTTAAGLR